MTAAAALARAPARPRIRLRFEDWTVEVAAEDTSDLRWLAAILAAGFAAAPGGRADARVELTVDAAACDRLERAGRARGPRREAFAADTKAWRAEPWRDAAGGRVFRDARRPLFYRVSEDATRVELVARERAPHVRRRLMQVVRELAMARAAASGGLLIHGAAVECAQGVVVMCGPKRSGKTTLLLSLLRTPSARYVANDRCVVRARPDGARVRGLPTLVSIRRDTLARVPGMQRQLGPARAVPEAARRAGRTSLSPVELCERLGVPAVSGGPLAALVFPRVGRGAATWGLRRLGPEEALPRLRESLFRASRRRLLGHVFVSEREPRHALGARALARGADRRLAETVPCFECRLGGGAAPGARESRALLGRLAAAVREGDRDA